MDKQGKQLLEMEYSINIVQMTTKGMGYGTDFKAGL